jgi:hypothetical protein
LTELKEAESKQGGGRCQERVLVLVRPWGGAHTEAERRVLGTIKVRVAQDEHPTLVGLS